MNLSKLRALCRNLWGRDRVDRDLDDELRATHALLVQEQIRAGLTPSAAQRAATMALGGLPQVKEQVRAVRAGASIESTLRDIRWAARGLRKAPGFALVAIVTLALGIGATTATFAVVYDVLLKPLPFDQPDRLVALDHLAPGFGLRGPVFLGSATYFTYRDNRRAFEDIALWQSGRASLIRHGTPDEVQVLRVTDGLLSLLRVRPALGRLIQKDDDVPGAPLRVLLTYGGWQRTFGGSHDVLGRLLNIDGSSYEIIGALPASFTFLDTNPEVVLPMRLNRTTAFPGSFGVPGIARLKSHVTIAQANADIARMIPLIAEQFPLPPGLTREMWDGVGLAPNLRPLAEKVIGDLGRPLWILLGAVTLVLLIAWSNVANLLLVRAEGRRREFAVRGALGASRARLAAAMLSETLLLGLAGGLLGVLVAQAGLTLLRRIAPAALPRVDSIGIDAVVLVVTLATVIITSLVFGLIPVLRFREVNVELLKEAGRTTDGTRRHRTRNSLVVVQVAIALVLLIVSGLMARTFVAMLHVQPGFVRPAEVQAFSVALPVALIREPQQVERTYEDIAERLRRVPGVAAVGLASFIAMDPATGAAPIMVEDQPTTGTPPMRIIPMIGPGYFETIGNPVVGGRSFTWSDLHRSTLVAMVSEGFAREYWGEPRKALGKRIGVGGSPGDWAEIVGVAGNERRDGVNKPAPVMVYFPMANSTSVSRNMSCVVRSTRVGSPGFLRELQQAVWAVNPNVPLGSVRTLADIFARSMAQTSFAMVMLAIAAGVALLLAVVGLYGVVSYIAAERTHEVGIRMALGAQRSDVLGLFVRQGLALSLTGVVVGMGVAVAITPIMSALLYSVHPMDPTTYVGVAITLSAITLLAMYVPARRASRVDPLIALRAE